ncbi:helix-turn-helix transcriptional regulator [Exiguobacterium sp. s155]|uniref:helix-turn-helix transcriptional regulator n=1 Tax=Exiguobacterium sp. s155 TaxID=2751286 RepID=UPI001BE6CCBE|nr:helix-turn-helix transcriptional regulator [Exiguobacterium sp. s155]
MKRFTMKQARLIAGYNQEEMAKMLEMSTNGYAKIERYESKFRIDKALAFAKIVELDVNEIIFFESEYRLTKLIKTG